MKARQDEARQLRENHERALASLSTEMAEKKRKGQETLAAQLQVGRSVSVVLTFHYRNTYFVGTPQRIRKFQSYSNAELAGKPSNSRGEYDQDKGFERSNHLNREWHMFLV